MKKTPSDLIEQANIYINAIEAVARAGVFVSSATMYAKEHSRVREHDKFTELCRKHGIRLGTRDEFSRYAFEVSGRKLFGRTY